MKNFVKALNRNPIFKFVSSVRLAVPLMLVLAAVVSVGTVVESLYNTEMAGLWVYKQAWFYWLMAILCLNIFAAVVSRYPLKWSQLGFGVTHAGMLTLMFGAFLTAEFGIDGQLAVPEGSASSTIFLPALSLDVRNKEGRIIHATPVDKKLHGKSAASMGLTSALVGTGYRAERFEPFVAQMQESHEADAASAGAGAISFRLQNNFADVNESVGPNKREINMGPVRVRYVVAQSKVKKGAPKKAAAKSAAKGGSKLLIKSAKSGELLKTLMLPGLLTTTLKDGTKVSVTGVLKRATVANNKLIDGPQDAPVNPALELKIAKGKETMREVTYAKFPDFSMNKEGALGLKFEYQTAEMDEVGTTDAPVATDEAPGDRNGDVIELVTDPKSENPVVQMILYKNDKEVMNKTLPVNTAVETPWMSMKVTLLAQPSMNAAAQTEHVHKDPTVQIVEPEMRGPMPPSAIKIVSTRPGPVEEIWLVEGSSVTVEGPEGAFEISYAQTALPVPFTVNLKKFSKIDYPGTSTPKSYESDVTINQEPKEIKISMNEPLQRDGYTLYQSSYVLNPGQPPVSVFSVNHDPGRPVKYAGSLILTLGIIIFTLMKSRFYNTRKKEQSV